MVTSSPLPSKRAMAKASTRLMLTTSGARLDADLIVQAPETPVKLKEDYTASLKNMHGKVTPWQTEEEKKQVDDQAQREELAELAGTFNGVFDSTAPGTHRSTNTSTEDAAAGIYNDDDSVSDDSSSSDDDSSDEGGDENLYNGPQ